MQSQLGAPHGQGQVHEVGPQDPGLHTVIQGEDKHHDDKPAVLKKVKEKVKKIKNKIGKKKHDDGQDRESGSSSDEEEEEEENRYKEDDDSPKITSAPASEPQRVSIGGAQKVEPEKVRLGDALGDVKEDPAAPLSTNPAERGGEEIGITPVVRSFEAMAVSDNPKQESKEPKQELEQKPEIQPSDTTSSTNLPSVTYTEKIKSMATVPTEYGKNIASTVYDKLSNAGMAVVQKIRGGPAKKDDMETSREVNQDMKQDKGVSVKEYVSEKLKPGEEDEALSELISEVVQRNKEGIQSKASDGMATAQTRAGGVGMVEKIRGAVTSAVGGIKGSDINTETTDAHKEGVQNNESEVMATDQTRTGGVGVVEKIRGAVTPAVGGGKGSDITTETTDAHKKGIQNKESEGMATAQTGAGGAGMVEKIRAAVTSVVGGGKGSDTNTEATDVHQEKGTPEVAEPMKLD